jgi:hypothetical protein
MSWKDWKWEVLHWPRGTAGEEEAGNLLVALPMTSDKDVYE